MSTPTEEGNTCQPLPLLFKEGSPAGRGWSHCVAYKELLFTYPAYAASQFFARALSCLEF